MYMIDFTPEQYAVFVGGVRYIKKVIKKKGKRKPTRNRKKKKGTRRRQKGGNKLLRTIINGLFLAALFSAYLIHTGTDMSLQTGIIAFSDASNLGVNADDVNIFMEGLAITIFYSGYGWDVAGQSIPSTCEEGVWAPSVPGYGRIDSLSVDPIPGWSTNCPKIAHILGTVLSSVLAGMFMAWIGPCIIAELAESIMGPPPPTPAPQITSSVQQSNDDAAQDILREAMSKIEEEEESSRRQQIFVSPVHRPRILLTRERQEAMRARSDARRRRCNFRNPPFPSDSDRAYGRMDTESARGQQLTTTNIQDEQLGNTLISLPREVMLQLQQTGRLEAITKMISEAAEQVEEQSLEWQGELDESIFRLVNDSNGESRLQLQDELPEVNCDTPLPAGSCPTLSKSTKQRTPAQQARMIKNPSDKGPTIEELPDSDSDSDSDLTAGGAKRKQTRRRRKKNKKTKKKRPRNKKKSHKRR